VSWHVLLVGGSATLWQFEVLRGPLHVCEGFRPRINRRVGLRRVARAERKLLIQEPVELQLFAA
jgi:hypothetical protein